MKKIIILLFFVNIYANVIENDKSYSMSDYQNFELIHTKQDSQKARQIAYVLSQILSLYAKDFSHSPSGKPTLVIASNKNQIANAFATISPFPMMMWYGSGGAMIDYFASSSWSEILALHETAHIFQLNAQSDFSKGLKSVFGNSVFPIFVPPNLPIIPIFTYPNIFLPTALLEGNAVFNESRFGIGGRLFSPYYRAVFLSFVKNNKIDLTSFINNHNTFPYTEEKYIFGAYFFAYLAQTYGMKKTNKLFITHAQHYIALSPFGLERTFKELFGKDLTSIFYEFLRFYSQKAKNFTPSNGEIIAKSKFFVDMSKVDGKILFLASNGKSLPSLHVLEQNKKTTIKDDFFLGKPFLINGKPWTTSSYKIYSLYDGNRNSNANFDNKIIHDINKDKVLYFKTTDFGSRTLYLNNEKIAPIDSGAIFDKNQSYYYFVQNGPTRTLHKNKTPLIGFDGFASKLCDIVGDKIYFTAATRYGSGLFVYNNAIIERMGNADDILDARHIKNDEFLTTTIASDGFYYKKVRLSKTQDVPVLYTYDFEQDTTIDFSPNQLMPKSTSSYNHILGLRYSSTQASLSTIDDKNEISARIDFIDALLQNQLSILLAHKQEKEKSTTHNDSYYGLAYKNTRYKPHLSIQYSGTSKDPKKKAPQERDYFAKASLDYKLIDHSRFKLQTILSHYYDDDYKTYEPFFEQLDFSYALDFPTALLPNTQYLISLSARQNTKTQKDEESYALKLYAQKSFFDCLSLYGSYALRQSNANFLRLSTSNYAQDPLRTTMLDLDNTYFAKDITSSTIGTSLAIGYGFYNESILSLINFSLFAQRQEVRLDKRNTQSFTITEDAFGIVFNTLLFRISPLKLSLAYVINDSVKEKGKVNFSMGASF